MFNEDWLGSLVPARGTSKGDNIIAIILVFLPVLFTAPRLLWLPSIFTFITACRFFFIGAKWNVFFNLEDFIAHLSKEELDSLLKP